MPDSSSASSPVVVTGANGLVGSRVCALLAESGVAVRAVVRRASTAPQLSGVEEVVGDFGNPALAESVVQGARAVVTTVHPMGSDKETQERVAVQGTPVLGRAARDAGVPLLVHVSTASVYEWSPELGDMDESSPPARDDAGDYAVTKRDTDAALAEIDGITTVLVRPPAILGRAPQSIWNSIRPSAIRDDEEARSALSDQTWPWIHLDDLASFIADLALGRIVPGDDINLGPILGACTAVNVSGPDRATMRDYHQTVCRAVGVEAVWRDEPAWTGRYLTDRGRAWGWQPVIDLTTALAELKDDLTAVGD